MKKMIAAAALALPLVAAGYASAGEQRILLSDAELDGVAAGASALAQAAAAGIGKIVFTEASTLADVRVVASFPSQATNIKLMKSTSLAGAAVSAN